MHNDPRHILQASRHTMSTTKPFTISTWSHIYGVLNVFRRLTPHLTTNQPLSPTIDDVNEIEKLEHILTQLRLRMPARLSDIILVTDFSPVTIAAVIFDTTDHSHPITCLSEKLPRNSPISSTHGEALAPVKILILTDSQAALVWMTAEPPFLYLPPVIIYHHIRWRISLERTTCLMF
eukprot:GHVP01065286.1.p1 GENE.GHVP01065286.1~~GHVP01065286.1.p1  ORF type:complete len:178 (-),score=5.26 GHVP01065286.1:892-1425(-)